MNCDIEPASAEIAAYLQASPFLPPPITEEMFILELPEELHSNSSNFSTKNLSVTMDNSLSPVHTLIQIICPDHKGILYDILRTLKDYSIQVSMQFTISNHYFKRHVQQLTIHLHLIGNIFCPPAD